MSTDHLRHRPEIDGLRAVAVLAVVLFHAGLGLPGGYVGVDVFFVISGFLITSLILRDLRSGRFSLGEFFERRVRRIVPALAVLVLATLVVGWFCLLPRGFIDLARSAVAVAALGANLYFWRNTAGYFTPSVDEMPLLHTWSLAVEEQFYLVVPLLLMAVFRFRALRGTRPLLLLAATALLVSLAFSVIAVRLLPGVAFFFLPSRAWELLCGAALAVLPSDRTPAGRPAREILGYAGLAGVVAPCFLLTRATPFPGLAAVAPCLGAALVIFANGRHPAAAPTSLARILAAPPVVFVGLISYSLYLWHWPVFAFCRYWSMDPLSPAERFALLALAFALAILSWRFVETPFRRRAVCADRRPLFLAAGGGFALVLALAGFVILTRGFPARLPAAALAFAAGESDEPPPFHRKVADIQNDDLPRFGPAGRPASVLLWGDSQAYCLLPAFRALADERGFAGVAITHGSRAPVLGGYADGAFGRGGDLPAWGDEVVKYVAARKIKDTFLAGFWQNYFDPADAAGGFPAALLRTIRALEAAGSRVWILEQIPSHSVPPPKYLARAALFPAMASAPADRSDRYLAQVSPMHRLAKAARGANVHFLDPAALFLDPATGRYRLEQSGRALYYDPIHITATTSRTLILPWLRRQLAGEL